MAPKDMIKLAIPVALVLAGGFCAETQNRVDVAQFPTPAVSPSRNALPPIDSCLKQDDDWVGRMICLRGRNK